MADLFLDLKVAARQLLRRPGFMSVAVLTLAIGMGVNAVAFSVVNGLLFKGSVVDEHSVGRILMTPGGDEEGNASLGEYQHLLAGTRGPLELGAEGRASVAWRHHGVSEPAYVLFVSANYFSIVGARLLDGHASVERGGSMLPAVVIGERFWRDKLGSPPLSGLTLSLNTVDGRVTGVMRESFTGPAGMYSPDLWLPLEDVSLFRRSASLEKLQTRWLFLLGKLSPGATTAAVQGHIDTAMAMMAKQWPDTQRGRGARFRLMAERNSELRGLSIAASIGMGIIGLILLLACFNVANLLLARAIERERDMGIRTALGARPTRLMRLVVVEGVLLALASGLVAILLASWTQSLISGFAIPIDVPQHIDFAVDRRVVAFVALLIVVAGVLPGVWPALAALKINVSRVLTSQSANTAGGRPSAMGRWLVGGQVAGSTAFLAMAALFIQSYSNLLTVDVGFARDRLVLADVDPVSHGRPEESAQQYVEEFAARLRGLPGIVDVAMADRAPFFIGFDRETAVWPPSGTCEGNDCRRYPTYAIAGRYFETMGISLISGRSFGPRPTADEVVVNQALANQVWPASDALGRTLRIGAEGRAVTVVGVTGKTHTRGLDREVPSLFVPLVRDHFEGPVTLIVRTAGEPAPLLRAVGDAAKTTDADVPLSSLKTMEQRMAVQLWPFRTLSVMFTVCGTLALVLSVVGLAGVVIHAVSRRIREFGVRIAIGAAPRDLIVDVLRGSARLLIPGLVAGLLLAAVVARLAQVIFVSVNVLNPVTYVAVALVQVAVVIVACVVPALRAARVDPLVALRAD